MIDAWIYLAAAIIGISLGLIGGGGSILTVPLLVYGLGFNPILATSYSLFVVGVSAFLGAINNYKKGLLCIKTAIIFAIPAFIAVYLTRLYLVPAIPDTLFSIGEIIITKEIGIMVFFALIMLVAAISMIRPKKQTDTSLAQHDVTYNYPLIVADGVGVGVLTGIVGAGGGFLIIPALVLLAKLPMKLAVGTSLAIIAAKSLVGFMGDLQAGIIIEWPFLILFTCFTVVGILFGGYLSNFIKGNKLKIGFGWFVLIMAVFILIKEIYN